MIVILELAARLARAKLGAVELLLQAGTGTILGVMIVALKLVLH